MTGGWTTGLAGGAESRQSNSGVAGKKERRVAPAYIISTPTRSDEQEAGDRPTFGQRPVGFLLLL